MKKENPFSVYVTVSQLAFVIITPLIVFLAGGGYVVKKYSLPEWVMGVCVALAIIFMLGGAASYIVQLVRRYGKDDGKAPKSYNAPRDNDYYDDYKDMRR